MKIGVVEIPGIDRNFTEMMEHHFHNAVVYLPIDKPFPVDVNLVAVTSNELYARNPELQKRVSSSRVVGELMRYASKGGTVVGIHSGMDILIKADLLPGRFDPLPQDSHRHEVVSMMICNKRSPLTYFVNSDRPLLLYNSNSCGRYVLTDEELSDVKMRRQILLAYSRCDDSEYGYAWPFSTNNIGAIANRRKNVFGIIPNAAIMDFHHVPLDGVELIASMLKLITC